MSEHRKFGSICITKYYYVKIEEELASRCNSIDKIYTIAVYSIGNKICKVFVYGSI